MQDDDIYPLGFMSIQEWGDYLHGGKLAADPAEIIAHCITLAINFSKRDDADEIAKCRADSAITTANRCAKAIQNPELDEIATLFFWLGMNVGEMNSPRPSIQHLEHTASAFRFMEESKAREFRNMQTAGTPEYKRFNAPHAKRLAQEYARFLWSRDAEHSIRIGEMAELVWAYLIENEKPLESVIPDRAAGLRPWLREIAPTYAKRPGRDRNRPKMRK